jgi:hypothetical protein
MRKWIGALAGLSVLGGLFLCSLYNYLLFHTLAELFSVIIACGIFMVAWNCRRYLDNHYFLVIGIAYLFVGLLDLAHTLSYEGMPMLHGFGANTPTQLWIAARYLEGLTLLAAPLALRRKVNPRICLLGYAAIEVLVLLAIFYWRIFPDCYLEGAGGLTPFKKLSEYIISVILLASGWVLHRQRHRFDPKVLHWLLASIGMTVLSELSFTTYASVYGFFNLLGHYFKILSFYFMYKAIIETGLTTPHELLFRELWEREATFRAIGELNPFGIWECDPAGRVVYLSQVWLDMVGMSIEECRRFGWMYRYTPEEGETLMESWRLCREAGERWEHEYHLLDKDGVDRWILGRGFPLRDAGGRITKWVGLNIDITGLKHIEQALKKSNEELEQFAYVASHDLQAPLRAMVGFLELIQSRYENRIDPEGRDFINRAMNAGHRMQALIQGLLSLSRVNTRGANFEPTDLNALLKEVLDPLQPILQEKKAEIIRARLPNLTIDAAQIQQLFQNLILNAVAYNENPSPTVEIECQVNDKVCRFSVKDNGIGIASQFHHRIFGVFQRLHTDREYPGTGLGLALCKKIVERHGGAIWVESEPEKGAIFRFTLPKTP